MTRPLPKLSVTSSVNNLNSQDGTEAPFALYAHIPFCMSKCPYCDFNSYTSHKGDSSHRDYMQALALEASSTLEHESFANRKISTIFFGGGTPSILSPDLFIDLMAKVRPKFITPDSEITLEANPGTLKEQLDLSKLKDFRSLGFNRISFGVQSFNPDKLRFLGRAHSVSDAINAIEMARNAGFENINLDLMYGVIGESLDSWKQDLSQALSLNPNHISAYNLTIEPKTQFGRKHAAGSSLCASDADCANMFLLAHDKLSTAGYLHYEVSNYAKPERECQHNLAYWFGTEYVGLGAGSHSYLSNSASGKHIRTRNIANPQDYIRAINDHASAMAYKEILTSTQQELEYLLLRLRTNRGFALAEYQLTFGKNFEAINKNYLHILLANDLAHLDNDIFSLSVNGMLLLDEIVSALTATQ